MSIKIVGEVWALVLPATEKIVLLCLADHSHKGNPAWPSIERICVRTGLKERAVQMALNRLEARRFITRDKRGRRMFYTIDTRTTCALSTTSNPALDAPKQKDAIDPHNMRSTPASSAPNPASDAPKPERTRNEPTIRPEDREKIFGAAGWRPSTKARGADADAVMRDWRAAGFDLDRDILPGIAKAIAERPNDSTSSLRRFITTITALHSANVATEARLAKLDAAPSLDLSGEDQTARAIRETLRKAVTDQTHVAWIGRCGFEVRDNALIITAPSKFVASTLESECEDRIEWSVREILGDQGRVQWRIDNVEKGEARQGRHTRERST